jgi:uncharacterized phage infection (PIP) family protein YhgE
MEGAAANGQSAAGARRAAERLREAGEILGGTQSQEAGQRMDAIAREAQRLAAAEADQSARIQKLKERGAASPNVARDVAKLTDDRQRMADALSGLQQNMRNAARELQSSQPAAAEKLRDALKEVDDGDLEPLIQRTADWLRTGIDPNARDTESQIAAGLKRLSEQTQDAHRAIDSGEGPGQGMREALDRVARLRRQIEQLGSAPGDATQPDSMQPGEGGGDQPRDTRPGGGATSGVVNNNIDTGNNARPGMRSSALPTGTATAADTEARIQQGLTELRALRQRVADDPEVKRQVQQLITSMEQLDPRRFPGNPHMIEQIHEQLLSDVDTLDLELRRNLAGSQAGEIRSPDPQLVPRGYEDAVADYFRRLSDGAARTTK